MERKPCYYIDPAIYGVNKKGSSFYLLTIDEALSIEICEKGKLYNAGGVSRNPNFPADAVFWAERFSHIPEVVQESHPILVEINKEYKDHMEVEKLIKSKLKME